MSQKIPFWKRVPMIGLVPFTLLWLIVLVPFAIVSPETLEQIYVPIIVGVIFSAIVLIVVPPGVWISDAPNVPLETKKEK